MSLAAVPTPMPDDLPDRLGRIDHSEQPCPNCDHDQTFRISLSESLTDQPDAIACLDCGDVRQWPR